MLSPQQLTLLHAVRGFAALYVVVFHAKFVLWVGGRQFMEHLPRSGWGISDYLLFASDMLTASGTAMVIVFFVLSGFFIAFSFDKNKWELKRFYLNRAIRIYVPFLFSVIFSIAVLFLVREINPALTGSQVDRQFNQELAAGFSNFNLANLLRTLVFLPAGENYYIGFNIVYWSLLYEAIFYLLIPVIIPWLRPYFWFSLLALAASYFFSYANPFAEFFFKYSIYFAVGLSLFQFIKNKPQWQPLPRFVCISLIIVVLGLVILLALAGWIQVSHHTAGLFSVLLILFLVNYPVKENLPIKFLKYMGKISYTLYLFHFPILILVYSILSRLTGQYLFYNRIYWVGVVVAVGLSYPLYFLVEEKSLRWISRLKKQRPPVFNEVK